MFSRKIFQRIKHAFPIAVVIVAISAALGFSVNALRPNGLPLIRKPMRETRRFAARGQMVRPFSAKPSHKQTSKPNKVSQKPANPAMEKQVATEFMPLPKPATKAKAPAEAAAKQNAKPRKPAKVEALFTTLADAKEAFDSQSAVFVDSRPIEDYNEEHIQGARSLDATKFDLLCGSAIGDLSSQKLIVTYCSDPECREATKLADKLVARGYKRVVILLEGLPGWKAAGYPVTAKEEGK